MSYADTWPVKSRNSVAPLILLAAAVVSALVLVPMAWIGVAALLGVGVVLYLIAATLDGKIEVLLLFWIAVFPLGYYFVSFPRTRAIVTLDRIIVAALLLGMCLASARKPTQLPEELRRLAVVWGCFVLGASVSLAKVADVLYSARTVFDGFVLPSFVAWCVIRNFDVRRHLAALHAMASLMVMYVAAIGAAEMALGTALMPLPGSGLYFAGSILRPNGPFPSNGSFALISLISFFFLLFLRRALGTRMSWWQRLLHIAGVASALAMALMPLFRSVGITLLLILLLDMYFNRNVRNLVARLALLGCAVAALVIVSVKVPDAYEDRSDSGNLYGRIAEQKQTFQLFKMHPFTGAGINNFYNAVEGHNQFVGVYKGAESVDWPHNNLGAILAETGLTGFVPYVAAQVLLIMAFRRLCPLRTQQSRTAWIFFFYVFLSYWVTGLSLTTGYSSELNLWYLFVLMVLYKYAITERGRFVIQQRKSRANAPRLARSELTPCRIG
jgi:O-antigen ligase